MKIVVINGAPQSGKDTFVEFCENYANKNLLDNSERYIHVYNISSVDFVKELAKYAGWNGVKDGKSRKFLSDLKDLLTEYDDIPLKKMIETINNRLFTLETLGEPTKNCVAFLHVREPKEIEKITKKYNALSLLIRRPGHKNEATNHADEHVDCYNYDYIYWNVESLDRMQKDTENFMEQLLEKEWYSENEDLNIWDINSYKENFIPSIKDESKELLYKLP